MKISNIKIGVIGLGYVGLPICNVFSKKYRVFGYDKNKERIKTLKKYIDSNGDIKKVNKKIKFTENIEDLKSCNVYIVTVPTPIYKNKKPNLEFIKKACLDLCQLINKENYIIFESTVYPGLTESYCIPLIEENSKLKLNEDFYVGYSPERINPGDNKRTIDKIVKVVSGSNKKSVNFINKLYSSVINAGTYVASSIKVAEAAKIIENCQRDLNIAFINEIFLMFSKMNIDPYEVLRTAKTKWNFLNFTPGLVGGHCIGVDPYYLTFLSNRLNISNNLILAGRKVNENMAIKISHIFLDILKKNNLNSKRSNLLLMGVTFKENCSDIRNSQALKIINFLKNKFKNIHIYDPYINKKNSSIKLINYPKYNFYDAILILLSHNKFHKMGMKEINKFGRQKKFIVYDFKKEIFN